MGQATGRIAAGLFGVLFLVPFATIARADGPPFDLPVDCPYGQCDVVHYVDHDPGPEIRDFACGTTTYEGHRGTDFSIPDEATMIGGVAVNAVAAGTVIATRDGVEDIDAGRLVGDSLKGIECGNGILINHEDGWQSQYCHLRRGSLAVKKGDTVERGQTIGLIGMSGQATFPHLHFNLRKDNQLIDPFSGTPMGAVAPQDCNANNAVLWTEAAQEQMSYRAITLYASGFSSAKPNATDIKRGYGKSSELPASSPGLFFWAYLIGAANGDVIRLRMDGPNGIGGHRDFTINVENDNGPRAKWFYVNINRPGDRWPAGAYRGEVTFTRPGQPAREIGITDLTIR